MFARSRSTSSKQKVKVNHKKRGVQPSNSGNKGAKGRTIRKAEAIQSWKKKSMSQLCTPPLVTPPVISNFCDRLESARNYDLE